MALADTTAFKEAIGTPDGVAQFDKDLGSVAGGTAELMGFSSLWTDAHNAGAAPSTAAACDVTTAGAMPVPNGRVTDRMVSSVHSLSGQNNFGRAGGTSGAFGTGYLLVDRLSHQGGLVGNSASAQTTNLPTAALTRYTSGVGVLAAIEGYTNTGSTDILTIAVSYTNQAGTAARAGVINVGGNTLSAKQFYIMSMAGSDTGVRSVESITLANSSGTAGNIGITLFKPIALLSPYLDIDQILKANRIVGWNTGIHADACLQILAANSNAISGALVQIIVNTHSV